jgi:sugar lactone lactonase YvrE
MKPTLIEILPKGTLLEGPLWDGGLLYYVDIVEQKIHRHNFKTGQHDVIKTPSKVGFAVLDENGAIIAGLHNGSVHRLFFNTDNNEHLADPARMNPANLANDGKCDRRGRLWWGTKNSDENAAHSGSLYRLDANGKAIEVIFPVNVSNGLAWSPDEKTMYYNDSTNLIWAFDYTDAGEAINQRVFVSLAKDGSVPDGMTVDSAGNLYCAMWGGSRVDVYNPRGEKIETISVPTTLQTSSIAFGGEDMKTLYISSAACDLTPEQKEKYPDSGCMFFVERNVPGISEARFIIR